MAAGPTRTGAGRHAGEQPQIASGSPPPGRLRSGLRDRCTGRRCDEAAPETAASGRQSAAPGDRLSDEMWRNSKRNWKGCGGCSPGPPLRRRSGPALRPDGCPTRYAALSRRGSMPGTGARDCRGGGNRLSGGRPGRSRRPIPGSTDRSFSARWSRNWNRASGCSRCWDKGEARPRIVALVGPPGSGKTTTLVKLAVNYGLASRRPVLLLSDGYLPGGRGGAVALVRGHSGGRFSGAGNRRPRWHRPSRRIAARN